MFKSKFAEAAQTSVTLNDVGSAAFAPFLQYLYSDHAPIEGPFLLLQPSRLILMSVDVDACSLLVTSNEFGVTRLVTLCELYITKGVERATTVFPTSILRCCVGLTS